MNYKKAYYHLFNHISDTIETLKKIQAEAEEACISAEETKIAIVELPVGKEDK